MAVRTRGLKISFFSLFHALPFSPTVCLPCGFVILLYVALCGDYASFYAAFPPQALSGDLSGFFSAALSLKTRSEVWTFFFFHVSALARPLSARLCVFCLSVIGAETLFKYFVHAFRPCVGPGLLSSEFAMPSLAVFPSRAFVLPKRSRPGLFGSLSPSVKGLREF